MKLAAQMFTVRSLIHDEASLADVLGTIRAMGYTGVQISGISSVPFEKIHERLTALGIECCITHESTTDILDDPRKVIDRLGALHCCATAVPHPGPIPLMSMGDVRKFAKRLNAAGQALRDASCILAYHNHALEFRRIESKPILEWIYELTVASNLQSELDTYWVQAGGGDPVAWIRRLKDRLPLLHVKDYGIDDSGLRVLGRLEAETLTGRGSSGLRRRAEPNGSSWNRMRTGLITIRSRRLR